MLHPPGPGKFSIGAPELPGQCLDVGELEAVSQEGIVVVDPVFPDNGAGAYCLATNCMTHEQVQLPGTGWQTQVHDGMVCFAKLAEDGSPITRPADDVFSKSMWRSKSTGEMFVRVGDDDRTLVSWDVIRSKHRHAKINFKTPDALVQYDMEAYIFILVRGSGCRMYWDLETLYEQCKLKSLKKCSKFINEKKGQWLKYAQDMLGAGQLIHWQQSKEKDWLQSCLPHTSMSTALLLAETYMWAFSVCKNGGLQDEEDRHAVGLLCQGLVVKAIATGPKQCKLVMNPQWQPRP